MSLLTIPLNRWPKIKVNRNSSIRFHKSFMNNHFDERVYNYNIMCTYICRSFNTKWLCNVFILYVRIVELCFNISGKSFVCASTRLQHVNTNHTALVTGLKIAERKPHWYNCGTPPEPQNKLPFCTQQNAEGIFYLVGYYIKHYIYTYSVLS